jgi:hypothetical protein
MLPSPKPGNRRAHVMGYTGEFIKPKSCKGKFNEYEFRWLNCNGGAVFRNSLSDLPDLMLLTHFGGSKLLEAFQDTTFTAETVHTFSQPIELFPHRLVLFVCQGNDQVEDNNSARRDKSDLKK